MSDRMMEWLATYLRREGFVGMVNILVSFNFAIFMFTALCYVAARSGGSNPLSDMFCSSMVQFCLNTLMFSSFLCLPKDLFEREKL